MDHEDRETNIGTERSRTMIYGLVLGTLKPRTENGRDRRVFINYNSNIMALQKIKWMGNGKRQDKLKYVRHLL